jgi:hypothetical protein
LDADRASLRAFRDHDLGFAPRFVRYSGRCSQPIPERGYSCRVRFSFNLVAQAMSRKCLQSVERHRRFGRISSELSLPPD